MTGQLDEYVKKRNYRALNSVLIYKGERIVLERYYNGYDEKSRHHIKSIWKSILSVCCGIAIDKGLIKSVDEPVAEYLPVFDGRVSPYHPMITVKHLLTMSSGIYWDGGAKYHGPVMERFNRAENHIEYISEIKMDAAPGTVFLYKEWDVILLSALLSAASGKNPFDFCREYLYKPLGIESGRWFTFPDGVCYNIGTTPAEQAESNLSARDLAKIGLLFKNGGKWDGERIVSDAYIREAVMPHRQKYGYLWWVYDNGYGCMGYGGQQVRVVPEYDIVYVLQATALRSPLNYDDVVNEALRLAAADLFRLS